MTVRWNQTEEISAVDRPHLPRRSKFIVTMLVACLVVAGTVYVRWDSNRVKCVEGSPMILDSFDPEKQQAFDNAYSEAFKVCPPGQYNANQPGLNPGQ